MQRVRLSSTAENMTILSNDIIRRRSYVNARNLELIVVKDLWKFLNLSYKTHALLDYFANPFAYFFFQRKNSPTRLYAFVGL